MNNTTKTNSIQLPSSAQGPRSTRLRKLVLAALVMVGATTFYVVASPYALALADAPGASDGRSFMERMHGMHSHADMHAHFDKVMTEAGVDDAQKQQIHAIMKAAMTDEHADMQRFHDNLGQFKTLLSAPRIDDTAIAIVRTEQDRLVLATSRRMSDTAVKVAKMLTPEQRAKLAGEIDQAMPSHGMQGPAG
jgi:Spy/CpxP family protein refolding chaperone